MTTESVTLAATVASPQGDKTTSLWEPSPQDVVDIWDLFTTKYGTIVQHKASSEIMQWVSEILPVLGGVANVPDAEAFLTRYTTVIGKTIYTPFVPGVVSSGWSLWSQLVICVHEHQHVVQYTRPDTGSVLSFSTQYLAQSHRRALFEADAYASALELGYWGSRAFPPISGILSSLRAGYALTEADVGVAQRVLEERQKQIRLGGIGTQAGREAIAWLNQRKSR